jgi:hypothetical protein
LVLPEPTLVMTGEGPATRGRSSDTVLDAATLLGIEALEIVLCRCQGVR